MLPRYSMLLGRRPSLGKYAASSPRAWGHWFWTIFTSPRSLKSGENLRGGFTPARPTTDIRSECFHLAFVFSADGVSTGQKWRGKEKKRENHTTASRNGQEIKIANRDWNFQRQPSVILLFVLCSRKARRPEIPRRGGEQWVPSFIHAKRPMAYLAV